MAAVTQPVEAKPYWAVVTFLKQEKAVAFLELCIRYQHSQTTCSNCNITVVLLKLLQQRNHAILKPVNKQAVIGPNFSQLSMHIPIPQTKLFVRAYVHD